MDKVNVDQAQAAVNQALATATPILAALQSASTALDFLRGAEKQRKALEREVADLQSQLVVLAPQIEEQKQNLVLLKQAVETAEQEMRDRVKTIQAEVDEAIRVGKAAVAAALQTARKSADAKQAQFSDTITQAQALHAARMGAMFAEEEVKAKAVAEIDAQLASLREQAKTFAATLSEG